MHDAIRHAHALGLPLGRHVIDADELSEHFTSVPDTVLRAALWQEWETATAAIRGSVGPIAACWISGSFLTPKDEPKDIDCVYVIHREVLEAVLPGSPGDNLLTVMISPSLSFRGVFGLRVDANLLPWWPRPGVCVGSTVRAERYLWMRGYWDDLWSGEGDLPVSDTRPNHQHGMTPAGSSCTTTSDGPGLLTCAAGPKRRLTCTNVSRGLSAFRGGAVAPWRSLAARSTRDRGPARRWRTTAPA